MAADGRIKILVVDDDSTMKSCIAELIQSEVGVELLYADSGRAALAVVAAEPNIGFVTTDVRMPNGNGIDFVRAVRGMGRTMPIVVISSVVDQARVELADIESVSFLDKIEFGPKLQQIVTRVLK